MKKTATLYLIPSLLGDSPVARSIPSHNLAVMENLRHFIAEEVRTARRFLKRACPQINIDELTFYINNEHSGEEEITGCIEPLLNGYDTGLLSEAGIPCVADPGAKIVELARQHQVRIVPLTGPSSLLLALMASGFNGQNFAFHGYLPIDKSDRTKKIREIERFAHLHDQTQIFIEAPYRNNQMLEALIRTCSDQTSLCVAVDLTLDTEKIEVRTIRDWKGKTPDLHKRPAVFLLYR